jgi:hypothetical protein
MLNNLSEQIRNCLQHAEECARRAAAEPGLSQFGKTLARLGAEFSVRRATNRIHQRGQATPCTS